MVASYAAAYRLCGTACGGVVVKIVVVSQRVDIVVERTERRDALDQKLCEWLLVAGYVPMPIPNRLSTSIHRDTAEDNKSLQFLLQTLKPSAVVLSGGNNVGECPERDDTERHLLIWAKDYKIPVLGLCRGMQIMGTWVGGKLKPVQGHVRTRHILEGELIGEANSFHDFSLEDCPKGFKVIAQSEDGEIEAIRHKRLPWEGWMWHPEREADFHTRDIQRLGALFER